MGLIKFHLRQILNLNFLFLSMVAGILGVISLGTIDGNAKMPYLWVDVKYLATDGYIALFLFFAGEISKDLLQQEKLTKRLEWKIANGIRIGSILLENTIVLWLGTILLLSPLCVIIIFRTSIFSLITGSYFAALCLLYAALINIAVLWMKNINHFRSIPVFITVGHILLLAARYWLYGVTESKALFFLFPLMVMLFLIINGLFFITKEQIVSSYY